MNTTPTAVDGDRLLDLIEQVEVEAKGLLRAARDGRIPRHGGDTARDLRGLLHVLEDYRGLLSGQLPWSPAKLRAETAAVLRPRRRT